jgi:hypothetical protein
MMLVVAWAGPHRSLLAAASGLAIYVVLLLLLRGMPRGALCVLRRSLAAPEAPAADNDEALIPMGAE